MGSSSSRAKGGQRDTKKKAMTTIKTTTTSTTNPLKSSSENEAKTTITTTATTPPTTKPLKSSSENESFVWKIDGFSSLLKKGNRITQTSFDMQGKKWVLGVNPMTGIKSTEDQGSEKHLSLILSLHVSTTSTSMLDTKFRFLVYDQKYGMHIEHEACHTYMMNNYHSGQSCMVSLKQLNDVSSRFLLNDTIVVGVELIQVKTLPCSLESTSLTQKDESSGSYSWYIEDFSKLSKPRAVSEPFQIAGYTWILSLYPEGYCAKNYVSIYLSLYSSKSQLPSSNGVVAHGTIYIKNQSGEDYIRNIGINYNPNNPTWGFSQFMRLEEFKDPSNGYLIKGACTIEVFLSISGSSICYKLGAAA